MRRDLVKKIQSSFLSCEKDTEEILNKLFFLTNLCVLCLLLLSLQKYSKIVKLWQVEEI